MKELSIEEKAKRYDEALERGKEINREHSKRGFKPSDDVLYLFPELKESEDERIRKELIQYLKDYPNLPNGQCCRDDFFAWLEKQRQDKSILSEEDIAFIELIKGILHFHHKNGIFDTSGIEYFHGRLVKVEEIFDWLGKRGEHKPTERSEEDKRHIKTIIRAIHGAGNITPVEGELAEKWFESLQISLYGDIQN